MHAGRVYVGLILFGLFTIGFITFEGQTISWTWPTENTYQFLTNEVVQKNTGHALGKLKSEYRKRLEQVSRACTARNTSQPRSLNPLHFQGSLIVEEKHSILYCGIPKVGSTFWKRVLMVMNRSDKYSSPFQMRLGNVRLQRVRKLIDTFNETEKTEFLQNAMSFMFVRDPYARLFSAYENKIYNPNMYFWKSIGAKITKAARRNATPSELKYGYNVTFTEFLRYIIKLSQMNYHIDGHFQPMHKHCDPCRMPYSFIGKLETFKADAMFLIDNWKRTYGDFEIQFNDFEKDATLDTAYGHISFLFHVKQSINNTYPFYNLVLRTWCSLQIRGLLSKHIDLPFKPEDVENITRENLLEAVKKALEVPVNRTEVKLQREEALVQAYSKVPLVYMNQLQKYVQKDCDLFGYDPRPPKLFERPPQKSDHLYLKGI